MHSPVFYALLVWTRPEQFENSKFRIFRDNVVCLPKKVAQALGNMSQIVICQRVSNVISLIDPNNLQLADVQG